MADLKCTDLCMTFANQQTGAKVEALKDINFTLKKGELLSVLGPSGCGKTTLLNMVAGFITPTSGQIAVGDRVIDGPGADRGMVFQQGALFEWLTVAKNVDFGLRMQGIGEAESRDQVEKWLATVGLQGFADTPTYQLSGGMQQRVALARCLVNDPDVILMDEPLGALDALTREKMQSLVLELWTKKRFTFMQTLSGDDLPIPMTPYFVEINHPGILLENKEKTALIFKAIDTLPAQQKVIFTLAKIDGKRYQEIVEITGKSLSSVESVLFRAKKNLQKKLANFYKNHP